MLQLGVEWDFVIIQDIQSVGFLFLNIRRILTGPTIRRRVPSSRIVVLSQAPPGYTITTLS